MRLEILKGTSVFENKIIKESNKFKKIKEIKRSPV